MRDVFQRQKAAYLARPMPTARERKVKLDALRKSFLAHTDQLVQALSEDFGHRSNYDSLLSDMLPTVNNLRYCAAHVRRWMRPRRRRAGVLMMPARVRVTYQPKGVVGIIVPWNFPLLLSVGPLAFALAAGNRVMIKMSVSTPRTNRVLAELLAQVFNRDEVAVFGGEPGESKAFSELPFDHLLFTGSTAVGRQVMLAAAENLTPVTLELGGKSPVIIDPQMPMDLAVERLIFGKCLNAGQTCVAPDYVLLPRDLEQDFAGAYCKAFQARYTARGAQDYTAMINPRHFERVQGLLEEAQAKGARVIDAGQGTPVSNLDRRMLSTQIVMGVTDEMGIMQEEIFGPLLPVIGYDSLEEALDYVTSHPRPLALYVMSLDKGFQRQVLEQTHSGGACVNDTILHVCVDDAPFGGVGQSGIGRYHGREGFETFSNARTVFSRGAKLNTGLMIHPPYGRLAMRLMLRVFLR
jgi:coniferyl-aldehyde dehydrogenase